jgi:glyoxylase-like metal-dependent hydrolase (beta-lactamase superfamily II)
MVNRSQQFVERAGQTPEEAKFFWTGGPIEVAPRTWFASMLSGVTAFETDDGLVLVDSGQRLFAPTLAEKIRERTPAPVNTAIYTHGHVDHAYGLADFLVEGQPAPRVIAHAAILDRFERYVQTSAHNLAINARQFGGAVDSPRFDEDPGDPMFARPPIPPTELYDETRTLTVGGVEFELHHARGETDDHTWVFCPDRGVLCPGDLIIWGVPNAGNPQKVQRYPWDWAVALREMAALGPRSIAPGHGGPVVDDADLCARILTETADFLEAIVERTIDQLNDGAPPHVDIVTGVDVPTSESPWLQPVYDEAEFIVRNVIRHYGGWFSGRPSELKPAPRAELARTVAELSGGTGPLLSRAEALADAGDLRQACHLADFALEADPADAEVCARVAALYDRRAETEDSLMAANIFSSASAYARAGRAFA